MCIWWEQFDPWQSPYNSNLYQNWELMYNSAQTQYMSESPDYIVKMQIWVQQVCDGADTHRIYI